MLERFTWYRQAAFRWSDGEMTVYIDPWGTPEDADPAELTPSLRRDADELDGFFEFLSAEISHPGLAAVVESFVRDAELRAALRALPAAGADGHHGYAGGLLEHTVGVATLCRETAQLHPRLRSDLLLAAALLHDVGRLRELGRGPAFRQTEEGRLLGHVHLGLRTIEERAGDLDPAVLSELLHAIACHHDRPAARTEEAAVLFVVVSAIVAFGAFSSSWPTSWPSPPHSFACSTERPLMYLMSAPAANARSPAPVRTIAPTPPSSRNSTSRSRSSVSVPTSSAFIASGRSIVTTATASWR